MMVEALNAAISGLKAAATRTNIASNNIANVNTDNFKRSIAVQSEATPYGTNVSAQKDTSPGVPFQENKETNQPAGEYSNVDMPREMVELISSKYSLAANIKVIQTVNENLGELLNIKI